VDPNVIASEERTGLGSIRIADDVVKVIAGLAAMEIKGVAGMSGVSLAVSLKCSAGKTCPGH
jgi:uncharacterized alkaline shock family protein YloU